MPLTSLDKDTVRAIGFLARIYVPETELESLVSELSSILRWIQQLQTVDTTDIEPMTSVVSIQMNWRDDIVNDGEYTDSILANAPESERGFFLVPKVID